MPPSGTVKNKASSSSIIKGKVARNNKTRSYFTQRTGYAKVFVDIGAGQFQKISGTRVKIVNSRYRKFLKTIEDDSIITLSRKGSLLADVYENGFTQEVQNGFGKLKSFMEQFIDADKAEIKEAMEACYRLYKDKSSAKIKQQSQV